MDAFGTDDDDDTLWWWSLSSLLQLMIKLSAAVCWQMCASECSQCAFSRNEQFYATHAQVRRRRLRGVKNVENSRLSVQWWAVWWQNEAHVCSIHMSLSPEESPGRKWRIRRSHIMQVWYYISLSLHYHSFTAHHKYTQFMWHKTHYSLLLTGGHPNDVK